jgi:hypothetical protein
MNKEEATMMRAMMRAKMRVSAVTPASDTLELLEFYAVSKKEGYPEDGSDENNTYARWTPSAELRMAITNPALIGKFKVGEEFYVDFTKVGE